MTLLRLISRLTILAVVLVPVCGGVALYLAFDRRPAVDRVAEFTPDHIERAKRILDANNPRRMRTGAVRTVAASAGDVDLAVNYLAHRYANGSAEAHMESGSIDVRASLRAPVIPSSPYVNVDVRLAEGSPVPTIERFRVGQLPLPASLAQFVLSRVLASVWSEDDLSLLRGAIKQVEFSESGARLTYEWRDDLANTVRTALIGPEDRERLRAYQEALANASRALPAGPVSMANLLTPLFALARERSGGADPVTENRAAILVLTLYVDWRPIADIVPDARNWPRPTRHNVTLNGRDDFPKHFMISAALAANTGGPFADAVGIYKEVSDSRGGSGFSFNDIAADRAGSRLGSLAEGRDTARRLQDRLGVSMKERDIMPITSDLPEFMPEPEFKRRFGGIGEPAYIRMMAEIEKRIAALSLYR